MQRTTCVVCWWAEATVLRRPKRAAVSVDPTIVAMSEVLPRVRVRVRGQVTRMRARPTSGLPSLAISVADGTGSVTAVWTGRRSIGGIALGRTVVIEGVPAQHGDQLEFINPVYTLCSAT
jgi:hypothetical protein